MNTLVPLQEKVAEAQRLVSDQIAAFPVSEVCVTSSFQAEDMVVVHMVREVIGNVPVIFLDTGYHFAETYEYRDRMTREWGLNLVNVLPALTVAEQESQFGILNQTAPDRCCAMRKVGPLFASLEPYRLWFTGLRREQAKTRANLQAVDAFSLPTNKQLQKVSPLADWSTRDVWHYAESMESRCCRSMKRVTPALGANHVPACLLILATPAQDGGEDASRNVVSTCNRSRKELPMLQLLIGFFIAVIIALTGVGAGVVTAPLLILFLHVPVEIAVSTALAYAAVVKLIVVPVQIWRKQVSYRILLWMLLGGIPGVILGSLFFRHVAQYGPKALLYVVLGAIIIFSSGWQIFRHFRPDAIVRPVTDHPKWIGLITFPIAAEVGFSSSGAGLWARLHFWVLPR